ncbi:hypothetical protein BH09BAC5_BH09BAC5_15430 [soil metagenome]
MKNEINNLNFSEAHFDVLLNHVLLANENNFITNDLKSETMAQYIFTSSNELNIPDSKGQQLIDKLTRDFRSGNRFRMNVFLITLITILSISVLLFFRSNKTAYSIQKSIETTSAEQKTELAPIPSITADELNSNPIPVVNPLTLLLKDTTEDSHFFPLENGNTQVHSIPTTLHIPIDKILHYEDIPTLTEVEKQQTEKDKMKMLKDIANPKKKIYSLIPMGSTKVNGAIASVQSFYIKNSEVTNIEYRTFLNDLLIQGKFDDYLLAVPVNGEWKKAGIPEFENVYFESLKYNDFPVVNISRKAAELYCNWLTRSFSQAVKNKEIKTTKDFQVINDFRLPSNFEWIYASRAGHDSLNVKWPWQYVANDISNSNGCVLCNFNYSISKDHLSKPIDCPGFGKLKQGGFNRAIITTAGLAIDTLLTAPVYSYNPNDYGLYCTMGNVSEMAWTFIVNGDIHKGDPISLGGNWNSDVNNVQIEAPEQYIGIIEASPMIGFRPVMTFTAK